MGKRARSRRKSRPLSFEQRPIGKRLAYWVAVIGVLIAGAAYWHDVASRRAWLSVEGVILKSPLAADSPPVAVVGFKNTGQLSANNVEAVIYVATTNGTTDQTEVAFKEPPKVPATGSFGPTAGGRIESDPWKAITLKEFEAVQAGTLRFLVWGRLTYVSTNGDAGESRFCAQLVKGEMSFCPVEIGHNVMR